MCVVARTQRIGRCTLIAMIILVLEDVNETRDGIEKLLKADGYRVAVARDEIDAIESAKRQRPDLILVSVAGLPHEVIATAHRVRARSAVGEQVPVVLFCIEGIAEGDEVSIGRNVHITSPDNFNQLRSLLSRLLTKSSGPFGVGIGEKKFVTAISNTPKPFIFRFIDTKPRLLLELTNQTGQTLKSIEILTIFLKDEQSPIGGP